MVVSHDNTRCHAVTLIFFTFSFRITFNLWYGTCFVAPNQFSKLTYLLQFFSLNLIFLLLYLEQLLWGHNPTLCSTIALDDSFFLIYCQCFDIFLMNTKSKSYTAALCSFSWIIVSFMWNIGTLENNGIRQYVMICDTILVLKTTNSSIYWHRKWCKNVREVLKLWNYDFFTALSSFTKSNPF